MQKYNFTLEFKNGILTDFTLIDQWFDIIHVEQTKNIKGDASNVFAYKILDVFSSLMQAVQIPLFSTGKIDKIVQNNKTIQICLVLNKISYIPKNIYTQILNISVNLLIDNFQKPVTSENIQRVFNHLDNKLIKPFVFVSGSGKSTIPFLKVAYEKNIPFEHLSNGIYQLGWGSNLRIFNRSIVDSDSAIGSQISQSKILTAQMLKNRGFPSPSHIVITNQKEAIKAAQILAYPLVVKPADKDRGEGVSVDIFNEKDLIKAFNKAFLLSVSKQVIVEKQVLGVCHRVFVANNKILYVVKRLPISVKGDGKRTISQLIDHENSIQQKLPSWKRSFSFPKDQLALDVLKTFNMDFNSILKKDQTVALRKIESTQWGGIDEDLSTCIHKDNIDMVLKTAQLFNLDVAGIDIITQDISVPWYKNGAIINEINFSPLLGGGEISKKVIPDFIDIFIKNNGRIPISIYLGDEALNKALESQYKKFTQNHNLYIVSDGICFNPDASSFYLATKNIYESCKALLMDKKVDSLIIASKIDPFFNSELPVDKIDKIQFFSNIPNRIEIFEENISSEDYHNIMQKFVEKINNPAIYFTQGNILRESGKYEEAKVQYNKALAIDSNLLEVYNNLAVVHLKQKNLPEAITEYRKAVYLLLNVDISKISFQEEKRFDTKHFEPILYDTLVLLAKHNIKAFPTSGTLLGLQREGGLLPFDKDIDIGLPFEQMQEATLCLEKNGWEEIEDSFGLINPKAFLHKKSNLTMDVVGFKKDSSSKKVFGGLWIANISDNWQRVTEHSNMELKQIQYPSGLGWTLKDPNNWLNEIYGKNWRVPDTGFDTVLEAKNIKSFSLLVQYYTYAKVIQYFTQGKFKKLNRTISIFLHHFPNDDLFIQLRKYIKNAK